MEKKRILSQLNRSSFLACFIFILAVTGCNPHVSSTPVIPTTAEPHPVETPTAAPFFTPTFTPTQLPTPAFTPTIPQAPTRRPTQTITYTPTGTPVPTYTILPGEVIVRSACLYGPGAPYLYKYGLVVGSNLEVIGRTDLGTWILVRAIGGNNPCWVKASLMAIKGDVMTVAPTYIPLPQSPYYAAPTGVWAIRDGDEVIVSWNPISFRAGDDTASPPYLVEAWVCTNGQLIFTPIGSYETFVRIKDEPGCSEPSHARVFGVEKHGYTRWVKVPWPQPISEHPGATAQAQP